jgi:hypothetical protein
VRGREKRLKPRIGLCPHKCEVSRLKFAYLISKKTHRSTWNDVLAFFSHRLRHMLHCCQRDIGLSGDEYPARRNIIVREIEHYAFARAH